MEGFIFSRFISILHVVILFSFSIIVRIGNVQDFPINFLVDIFPLILIIIRATFFGILIYIGLYLGKRVGLGAPLLENWIDGGSIRNQINIVLSLSFGLGVFVTGIRLLLDYIIFSACVPSIMVQWEKEPIEFLWIVPFEQGIIAEIIYRLFLMTLIVWVLIKNQSPKNNEVPAISMWISILAVSFISGVILSLQGTIFLIKLQYITLSCIGSIIFGWLYWKKGIESAIIAHFTSNVVMILAILILDLPT